MLHGAESQINALRHFDTPMLFLVSVCVRRSKSSFECKPQAGKLPIDSNGQSVIVPSLLQSLYIKPVAAHKVPLRAQNR